MATEQGFIYVVAHDGGCEGYRLPSLAFWNLDDARSWIKGQTEAWSIARVPIHPNFPDAPWYRIAAIPHA